MILGHNIVDHQNIHSIVMLIWMVRVSDGVGGHEGQIDLLVKDSQGYL
jgi:hypothetical protein